MELKYELTKDDLIEFNYFYSTRSKRGRRRVILVQLLEGVMMPLILFALAVGSLARMKGYFTAVFDFALALFFFLYFLVFYKRILRRGIRRMVLRGDYDSMLGEQTVCVGNGLVTVTGKNSEAGYSEPFIKKIGSDDSRFYLFLSDATAYIVPKRVFGGGNDEEEFVRLLEPFVKPPAGTKNA